MGVFQRDFDSKECCEVKLLEKFEAWLTNGICKRERKSSRVKEENNERNGKKKKKESNERKER